MPRFLDPNNPQLNSLVRAKKIVNRRNLKKYAIAEQSIPSVVDTTDAYLGLTQRLTGILSSLVEITQTLVLTETQLRPQGARQSQHINVGIADRYLSASSALIRIAKDTSLFFKTRLGNSLNSLTGEQVADIQDVYKDVINKEALIGEYLARLGNTESARRLTDIFDEFSGTLNKVLYPIGQSLLNYKQIQPLSGGATALRVGLDFAPTFATADRHPPRNTADFFRPSLPRRFQ